MGFLLRSVLGEVEKDGVVAAAAFVVFAVPAAGLVEVVNDTCNTELIHDYSCECTKKTNPSKVCNFNSSTFY